MTNVVRFSISRSSASWTNHSDSASSAEVASSRINRGGFFRMALARPVVYALGARNRGAGLTGHADKERSVTDMLFRQRESMRSGGTAG